MLLGNKISFLRGIRGYSKEQLSTLLSVPVEAIEKWENNTEKPNEEAIKRLASVLNVSENYLLSDYQIVSDNSKETKGNQSDNYRTFSLLNNGKIVLISIWLIIGAVLSPFITM